jgi:hypothetical protein
MDTSNPYDGRTCHWIKPNEQERSPHRWIVADTEGKSEYAKDTETQTLRCWDAVRWRDDLKTGDHAEWNSGEDAEGFWRWVDEYCRAGHRTVLWFHNESYDLRTLRAFEVLPALGWRLEWCNLSRDVSVTSFRSDHGTLVVADTYSWVPKPLAEIGGLVGIGKPPLPAPDDTLEQWHHRCKSDVVITRQVVIELLAFLRGHHLGNWKPSGAGMGYAAWRHRFLTHKVLVHNDAPALVAEREAMHTGRAEAWWHGKCKGGPFTEWDMHMSYCRIAAECDVPVKLFAYDDKPTKAVHEWAMKHWTILARVKVTTAKPVVPCHHDNRIIWPVGEFETTLWQPELELITNSGGTYEVLEQWRYNSAPALQEWARWSMFMCAQPDDIITPVQRAFVKHQSRAVIGRFGLSHSTGENWGANPYQWLGLTDLVDGETGETSRMLHVGEDTFVETARKEADSSLPQITGWIMSEARVRLWTAAETADFDHVMHMDTDSIITDRAGTANMEALAEAQLRGGWRAKDTWHALDVTGPRHYRASGRRVIPGVPRTAQETEPGRFTGQVWQSLSGAMAAGQLSQVYIVDREWRPKQFDGRRPWKQPGPAEPIRLPQEQKESAHEYQETSGINGTGSGRPIDSVRRGGRVSMQTPGEQGRRTGRLSDGAEGCVPGCGVNDSPGNTVRLRTVESVQRDNALTKQAGTPAKERAPNDRRQRSREHAS